MTEGEVRKMLQEHGLTWNMFFKWMANQAITEGKNGEAIYHKYDVARYVKQRTGVMPDL